MDKPLRRITLQVGCRSEWHALEGALSAMAVLEPDQLGPFSQYHKVHLEKTEFIAFQGGPSKTVAGAACQHALMTFEPDLHLMVGTCGGVSGRPQIGGLMYADRAAQYDCVDRLTESSGFYYPTFDVHLDNRWIRDLLELRGLIGGMIATADQDIDHHIRTQLTRHGADGADWESAAVALVCHYNRVPALILRGVSDLPDESLSQEAQAESFLTMTPMIMGALAGLIPVVANVLRQGLPKPNTRIPALDKPFRISRDEV